VIINIKGIEKYWKDYAKPFLAVLYGSNDVRSLDLPFPSVTTSGAHHALVEPVPLLMGHESGQTPKSVDDPVQTVMAQGRINLIQPFITRYQGDHEGQQDGDSRNHEVTRPLPTVDTSNRYALVEPLILEYYGNGGTDPVSLPLGTVTTKDRFALLEPFLLPNEGFYRGNQARPLDKPLSTVTASRGFGGMVSPVSDGVKLDIRFRMLKNHELKKAQGFPDDYKITGNITEQTKQIGNAVPVNTAKALAMVAMGA